MFKKTIKLYKDSFSGLSTEIWWLALITLINRAGTMVIPFLSIYLIKQLDYTIGQAGWVMTGFGVGSFIGSWIGGKLTDKIGFYKVMVWSLFGTGLLFLSLQYITSFWLFTGLITLTMIVADAFRPAMFVSLKAYSKPENQTRSLTLIRLAINLGFSLGPFLGGMVIAMFSYKGLFWIDGITCLAAVLVFMLLFKEKEVKREANILKKEEILAKPALKDFPYLLFLVIMFIMSFTFFQLFSTIPLYYKDIHLLDEVTIGILMSINGMIIFIFEMPLIYQLEKKTLDSIKLVMMSLLLISCSFFVFNINNWSGLLVLSMLIISVAEIIGFPFANTFALNRSPKGRDGEYMALFTMSFSLGLIFSSKAGMEIVDSFGYSINWYIMGALNLVAFALGIRLLNQLKKETRKTVS